ncbi:hypothetical protein ACVWWN_004561 [Mycobacterium sp. URHB0021]
MVQVRWTSRCLLATLNLAVKMRPPAWTTLGTLLAGTIALPRAIFEPFCAKQGNKKFDL